MALTLEHIPDAQSARYGYDSTGDEGPLRRRRIEFLLRVLGAPRGVWRPYAEIKEELDTLIKAEWRE